MERDRIREQLGKIFPKDRIDKLYEKYTSIMLLTCKKEDLTMIGTPPRMAEKIEAIFQLRVQSPPCYGKAVSKSSDCFEMVKDIANKDYERFEVLYLNQNNRLIKRECHSKGGTAGTLVDSKKLLRGAIQYKAAAIILAHNHPSGNSNPSKADINVTKKIKEACKYLDISLLDHIIVNTCNRGYTSMADEGLI